MLKSGNGNLNLKNGKPIAAKSPRTTASEQPSGSESSSLVGQQQQNAEKSSGAIATNLSPFLPQPSPYYHLHPQAGMPPPPYHYHPMHGQVPMPPVGVSGLSPFASYPPPPQHPMAYQQNWMPRSAGGGGPSSGVLLPNYPHMHYNSRLYPPNQQQQENNSLARQAAKPSASTSSARGDSPSTNSSIPDDSLDDTKSVQCSPFIHQQTPSTSAGQGQNVPTIHSSGANHLTSAHQSGNMNAVTQDEVVERLAADHSVSPEIIAHRRIFFRRLVQLHERENEPLSASPQVSKSTVDLYRLYHAVMKRGGFQKVIKDKIWKHLCTEASSELQESSAAGFQLKKHYRKYLLKLECCDTGANIEELIKFDDTQKKKKREKDSDSAQQQTQSSPQQQSSSADRGPPLHQPPPFLSMNFRGMSQMQHPQYSPSVAPGVHHAYPPTLPYPAQYGSHPWSQQQHPGFPQHGQYPIPYGMHQPRPSGMYGPGEEEKHAPFAHHSQQRSAEISNSRASNTATPIFNQAVPRSESRASSTAPASQGADAVGGEEQHRPRSQLPGAASSNFSANAPTPPLIASALPLPASNRPPSRVSDTSKLSQNHSNYNSSHISSGPIPAGDMPSSAPLPYTHVSWLVPPYNIPPQRCMPHPNVPSGMALSDAHLKAEVLRRQHINVPQFIAEPSQSHPSSIIDGIKIEKQHLFRQQLPAHNTAMAASISMPSTSLTSVAMVPGSLKATATSFLKKREKAYCKDLHSVSSGRLLMALRSGMHVETVWAINALNVMLYDDLTGTPPNCAQMPEILDTLVDYMTGILSILSPKSFEGIRWTRKTDPRVVGKSAKNDKTNDTAPVSFAQLVTTIRPVVKPQTSRIFTPKQDFTMISRNGHRVQLEENADGTPEHLENEMKQSNKALQQKNQHKFISNGQSEPKFNEFVERIRHSILSNLEARNNIPKPCFSVYEAESPSNFLFDQISRTFEPEEESDVRLKIKNIKMFPFFYRRAYDWEKWDDDLCLSMDSLIKNSKPTALQFRDEVLVQLSEWCLAISNIIRGFSFVPESEKRMVQSSGLLQMIALLLRLNICQCDGAAKDSYEDNTTDKMPLDFSSKRSNDHFSSLFIDEDSNENMLLELTDRLRDDAFVILSNICSQLDLYEIDSEISYAIFDALLYWVTSSNVKARNPLTMALVSPRDYCLDIFCRMSVIERNVDVLLSTGPWPRLEAFVKLLCKLLPEGPPIGEFAIVILNVICATSEPACFVAVSETQIIRHIITFLELADTNMHQIVQQLGINALRENPEKIGTSVGMLRRASFIMAHIARHENCREYFLRYQSQLLPFTVSSLMDSRVAALITDVLFEIQRIGASDEEGEKDEINESLKRESFSACSSTDHLKNLEDLSETDVALSEGERCADEFGEPNNSVGLPNGEINSNEGGEDSQQAISDIDSESSISRNQCKRKSSNENVSACMGSPNQLQQNSPDGTEFSNLSPSSQQMDLEPRKKRVKNSDDIKELIRNNILKQNSSGTNNYLIDCKNGMILLDENNGGEKVNGIAGFHKSTLLDKPFFDSEIHTREEEDQHCLTENGPSSPNSLLQSVPATHSFN